MCFEKFLFIVHYRCGSLEAEYDVIFDNVNPPTSTNLTETLQESFQVEPDLVLDDGTRLTADQNTIAFTGISFH